MSYAAGQAADVDKEEADLDVIKGGIMGMLQ